MYKIIDTHTKTDVKTGFATREDAKPERDKLNSPAKAPKKDAKEDGKEDKKATKASKKAAKASTDDSKKDVKPRFVIGRDALHPRGETDGFDHTARKKWT